MDGAGGGDAVCRAPQSFKCCSVGEGGGSLNILNAGAGIQGCAFAYSVQLLSQPARIPRIDGRDNALNVNYGTQAVRDTPKMAAKNKLGTFKTCFIFLPEIKDWLRDTCA